MKVKSESEDTQSYLTLSDPMDCSLPDSSIHEIFQARVLEWGAIAFSENLSCHIQISKCFEVHLFGLSLLNLGSSDPYCTRTPMPSERFLATKTKMDK